MTGHGFNASGTEPATFCFDGDLNILRVSCIMADTIFDLGKVYTHVENDEILDNACSLARMSESVKIAPKELEEEVKTVLNAGFLEPTHLANEIMQNVMHHRIFFITKTGHLGIAPSCSIKGDIVCIIRGCNFPIILREEANYYIVVGEAYGMLK